MATTIGTIRQVYLALKRDHIPLSEAALRGLVAAGEIPSLRSGRNVYIQLEAVKEYLDRRLSLPPLEAETSLETSPPSKQAAELRS